MNGYGRVAYETYGESGGWRTFDGRPMPTWDDLALTLSGRETRRRWEVAASKVYALACMQTFGLDGA